jgi:hypothetical protein
VFDSLAGHPLVDANVELIEDARATLTDSAGAFRFDSVDATAHTVVADHPVLRQLGFGKLTAKIDATSGSVSALRLATPSFQSVWRRLCSGDPDSHVGDGFVFGRVVLDSLGIAATDSASAIVEVSWRAAAPDSTAPGGVEGRKQVRINGSGLYSICGVPSRGALTLTAAGNKAATVSAALAIGDARIARRDITLPAEAVLDRLASDSATVAPLADGTGGSLAGIVRDSAGRPMRDARVKISGLTGEWRSAADGVFTVTGIPEGVHEISTSALGFLPERRIFQAGASGSIELDLSMTRIGATLDSVKILGEMARKTAQWNEVELRVRSGLGFFVDSTRLQKMFTLRQAFNFPRVNVVTTGAQWTIVMQSGITSMPGGGSSSAGVLQPCNPTIWIDGYMVQIEELNELSTTEVGLIEVFPTAARAPSQSAGTRSNCGVVLVWRKSYIAP